MCDAVMPSDSSLEDIENDTSIPLSPAVVVASYYYVQLVPVSRDNSSILCCFRSHCFGPSSWAAN